MHVLFAKTLLNTPTVPQYLLRLNGIKKKKRNTFLDDYEMAKI